MTSVRAANACSGKPTYESSIPGVFFATLRNCTTEYVHGATVLQVHNALREWANIYILSYRKVSSTSNAAIWLGQHLLPQRWQVVCSDDVVSENDFG